MGRPGLVQKKINVRLKSGKTAQRSMWVRAKDAVSGAVRRHGMKVAIGAASLGAAALLHHHREGIGSRARGAGKDFSSWRKHGGAKLAEKLIHAGGMKLAEHYGEKVGQRVGARAGKALGKINRKLGKHATEFGHELGGALGEAAAGHVAEGRLSSAGKAVASRLRRKNLLNRSTSST